MSMNLPGYTIHSLIGEGGMAKVYLATQDSLDRKVALKVMDSALKTSDKGFCDRFYREGKIIARLNHPGIITIHNINCDDPHYFMSMEYCGNGHLKQRIEQGLDEAQALDILQQVAAALGYAHSFGFLHRDVKPANILFRDDDTAVLSDFGIARELDPHTQLTAIGFTVGTPEYMSPEQAAGKALEPGSDLYSLGIVFYEMLTGSKPYSGSDGISTAIMHLNHPIPELPAKQQQYQPILNRLLAKTLEERYKSAEELISDLEKLTQSHSVDQAPRITASNNTRITRSQLANSSPIKPLLYSGIVMTMGLLAFGGWYFFGNEPDDAPQAKIELKTLEQTTLSESVSPRIELLLETARAHKAVGRLKQPPGSNAYDAYMMVLEEDPENREALAEIEAINRLPDE